MFFVLAVCGVIVSEHPLFSNEIGFVIFNESTTHGTLPWQGKQERRSLFYRYTPKYMHYAGGMYKTKNPAWVKELTDVQQAVLAPPYVYNRPLIDDGGVSISMPRREGE